VALALQQHVQQRRDDAEHPHGAHDAAGAGQQPEGDLGQPKTALGSSIAMRWWQASAISSPPPSAVPFSAATTGLPSVSSAAQVAP
jgi:hypothetical protein